MRTLLCIFSLLIVISVGSTAAFVWYLHLHPELRTAQNPPVTQPPAPPPNPAPATNPAVTPQPQPPAPEPGTTPPPAPEPKPPPPPAADPSLALKPRTDDKSLVLTELDKKLETYHKLIKPQPGEWKFAEVPWQRTVWDARKKAADEGKPVFIWYMAGEPLGQC
jgi:hypothetical protein